MGIKISEYTNTGTSLSASDLTEFSKLISTGPDVWQTQKLPYSVLLTELTADLNFVEGSGTLNYIPRFTAAGTIADGSIRDNLSQIGVGASFDSSSYAYIYNTAYTFALNANNAGTSNILSRYGIYGQSIVANSGFSNGGVYGVALNSTGGNNIGVRGLSASQSVQTTSAILTTTANADGKGVNLGGFFQANTASTTIEAYGVVGSADATGLQAGTTYIGGYFRAKWGATNYAIRLEDGSEGIGKFLKSIDEKGRANWATVNDYTADATPDSAADYFLTWDASAGLHKKVLMSNVPSSAVTLYNSNSTFTASRTAKLSGNTSSEFLTFQTLAGNNIAKFYGDNSIDFGNSTAGRFRFYTNAAENDNVIVYSGNTPYAYFQSANRVFLMYGTNANNYIQLDATGGGIRSQGTAAGISLYSTTNQLAGTFSFAGGGGWFKLLDAGVSKVEFYAPANQYYMAGGCSFGYVNSGSPAAIMDVRGNSIFRGGGSTSSTFTAIFRNSSIVDLLTIRDDGQVSFKNFTLGLYGATPVAQHSTTGTITGITHSGGAAVGATDTFTGAVGTTAYTLSDLVKALKNIGILAQ